VQEKPGGKKPGLIKRVEHMIIEPDFVLCDIRANSKKHVLEAVAKEISRYLDGACSCNDLLDALLEREKIGNTAIGGGVAIPHVRLSCLDNCFSTFIRLPRPVSFDAYDGEPVDLIYLLLAPATPNSRTASLMQLARISNFFRNEDFRNMLRNTEDVNALIHSRNDEIAQAA
jgi:PTS system nitrogen regulatory IIA component